MTAMRLDGGAIEEAERQSVLTILGDRRTAGAIEAIGQDAQGHADWLVEGARRLIPPGPIACREGCTFCCHLEVIATIPEVLRIAAHLLEQRTAAGLADLRARIATHRDATSGPTDTASGGPRPACPLLAEDRCTVYSIRPMSCRGWNSLDVRGCEAHHADPARGTRVPVYGPQHQVNAHVQAGMVAGLQAAGLEHERVELVAALQIAVEVPDSAERWLAGERLFRSAIR